MRIFEKNYFLFTFLFLICGIYSVQIGTDATIELFFYHLWNGYSFVTKRFLENQDFAFLGFETYFNPLCDAVFYILSKSLNKFPDLFMFIQGFFPALSLFFLHKTIYLLIKPQEYKLIASIFTITFAASSILFFHNLGTSLIDLQIAFLPLAAIYIFFKYYKSNCTITLFVSGFLLGIAPGLKLTTAMYSLAFFMMLLFDIKNMKKPVKSLFTFVIGGLSGYLLVNGYWAYYLWKNFGNPMFPLYNNIFRSPLTDTISYQYVVSFPLNIIQWIAYPFFWYSNDSQSARVIYAPYNNISWAFVYAITVIYVFLRFFPKWKSSKLYLHLSEYLDIDKCNYLVNYIVLSYILWLNIFAVLRYAIGMDLFIGLFIFIFLLLSFAKLNKAVLYIVLTVLLCFQINHATTYPHFTKKYVNDVLFEARDVHFPDNSVVFSAGFPIGYAAVYQNPNVHYVYSFNDPGMEFQYTDKSRKIVNDYINKANGNIYAILGVYGYDGHYDNRFIWEEKYILDNDSCKIIENNFIVNDEFIGFCKVIPVNKQ